MRLHRKSACSVSSYAGGGEDAYDQCRRLHSIFPVLLTAVYRAGVIRIYKGVQPDSDDPYKCGGKRQGAIVVSDRNARDPAGAACDDTVYGAFHLVIAAYLPELPAMWTGVKNVILWRRK